MTKEEALQLVQEALEALENISTALREDDVLGSDIELMLDTIVKIHAALAQPEQDNRQLQIAMRQWDDWKTYALELQKKLVKYEGGSPMLLNAQTERPWVGLTKEEIDSALSKYQNWYEFAAHLENILKEKNQ